MLKPSWLSKVRGQFLRSPTPQQIRRRCGVDCQGVAARAERMKGRNTPLVPLPFGARLGTIIIDRNLDLVAWLVIITLGHYHTRSSSRNVRDSFLHINHDFHRHIDSSILFQIFAISKATKTIPRLQISEAMNPKNI